MEECVIVHCCLLTVTVPVGTQDPTANTEVTRTHNLEHTQKQLKYCVFPYLQTVVPPVRMEERAIVHLPMLTATVPVGTQETTARNQVLTHMHPGSSA